MLPREQVELRNIWKISTSCLSNPCNCNTRFW